MNEYAQGFLDAIILVKHYYEKYKDRVEEFEKILDEVYSNILTMKIDKIRERLLMIRR